MDGATGIDPLLISDARIKEAHFNQLSYLDIAQANKEGIKFTKDNE